MRQLLASSGGLVRLRGQWVELDRERLREVLAHWERVRRAAEQGGLSFLEGMRLLAGAAHTEDDAAALPAGEGWSRVEAGTWLARTLEGLFHDRRAVWTDDAVADPRFANSLFARFPHRSAMAIPLVADAETSGGFYLVWWEHRRQFEAEEVQTLEAIGEQVGVLLRNALDAQRTRAELAHVARISTMDELAASLAHELIQPLTAILSNAQAAQRLLAANPDDLGEVQEILKDIVEDDKRAGEVIHRLRALVRKEQPAFALLDLGSIIRDVVLVVHSEAVRRNSRVSVNVDPGLPPVRGDRIQLQQVVLNLLVNAFDAMRERPAPERRVVVRAELEGARMAKVSVHDRGLGLSADTLDRIFQPFYTTKHEGLGIGLSISRAIIEAHGGRLWAENNPDRGATFYFTVPVGEATGTE